MSQVAFALRADIDSDSFAGSVSLPDGVLFDVGDALKQGDGVIVTEDEHVINALDGYVHGVERTTVPEKAEKPSPAPVVDPALAGTSGEANEGTVPKVKQQKPQQSATTTKGSDA